MLIASFAGAGLAALVAAGAGQAGASAPEAKVQNPLLAPWTGPYGGVPPFDKVKVEHFKPALEAAMAEQLAEIDKIANDPAPPTFENTLAALERAGRALDRVSNVFGVYSSTMSTPDFQEVEREMAPRLAAFSDQITQNEKLFRRIAAVYDAREKAKLTPEQKRLAWLDYTNFVRAGARLDAAGQEARCPRSTSGWPPSTRSSARTCWPTRPTTCSSSTRRRTSPACPSRCAPAPPPPPSSAGRRASGPSPTRAPAWSRSSPTRTAATCARRSGARTTAAATTATPRTTTRSSPRS